MLGRISANIPQHLQDGLMKEVKDSSEEDLARMALASPDISASKKRRIQHALDSGKFNRTETVVDESVVAELDKYHTQAVGDAIRRGELTDPSKDEFVQKRAQRMKAGKPVTMSGFKPLGKRILVSPRSAPGEEKKHSFIIIPDSVKKESHDTLFGTVHDVGPGVTLLRRGQVIIFKAYSYDPVVVGDMPMYVMEEDNVIATYAG